MKKILFTILVLIIFIQNIAKAEVAMIGVVDGMVCMACQAKVEKELKAATGEGNVGVSWPEGVAVSSFDDKALLSEDEYKNTILGTGFEVVKVITVDEIITDAEKARKLVDR